MKLKATCGLLAVPALLFAIASAGFGQTKPERPASNSLTAQQYRGEGIFLQRCSVCHLRRDLKFGSPATNGPSLKGLFKAADADEQTQFRETILQGGPNMPGFQYGLRQNEVEDLVAYLKIF